MKASDYEILFDLPSGEWEDKGINGVRTVTYRAGASLEVICHPIVRLSGEARREAKRRRTSAAMEKINQRNCERRMMRLIEENFTPGAVVVTLTYPYPDGEYGLCDMEELSALYESRKLPWDLRRVRKDVTNYLNKLRRRVKQVAGDSSSFKWVLVIEEGKAPPTEGLPPKYHVHAVIEGDGLDRGTVETLWQEKHGRVQSAMLDMTNDGAARLARYFCKQRRGGRWWSHSRNLKNPVMRVSDRRVSRRRLARIAADVQRDGREILEKLYPGYRVVELPDVYYSDYVAGAYIYARLRRRDVEPPPWERVKHR